MKTDGYRVSGRVRALSSVEVELERQDEKWGVQNLPDGTGNPSFIAMRDISKLKCDRAAQNGTVTYGHILLEEVYEAMAEVDNSKLAGELVQVAAVAVAWVEKLMREAG